MQWLFQARHIKHQMIGSIDLGEICRISNPATHMQYIAEACCSQGVDPQRID